MRILHIHSGNLYGGVETVLRTMAQACAVGSHVAMEFALCFEGRIADEVRSTGCKVHILGPVHASQPLSVWRARTRLAALCRESSFDATIAHSPWTLSVLAPSAPRPLVYYQHDIISGRHWTEHFSRLSRPNLIVANSRFTADSTKHLFPHAPVSVLHPPAELFNSARSSADRQALRRRFQTPEGSLVILQASRFEPWKGHRLLLDALAWLRQSPEWFLWIAGEAQRPAECDLRRELEEHAAKLGLAHRIAFLGHVTDMPAVMHAADIYCQPNTQPEPFGLTYVEALHAELPVIGTNLGGAKEILSPGYGLLPEPNCASLAVAIGHALTRRDIRENLAAHGPLRAKFLCDARVQTAALAHLIDHLKEAPAAA